MKKLSLVLFLLFSVSAYAQEKENYGQDDPKATKLLEELAKKYKAYKTIKADFVHSLYNKDAGIDEKEKGEIVVKGNKFHVKLDRGSELYCDGSTSWAYDKELNEVTISDYDPDEDEINPSQIFTMYSNGYLSMIAEEKKVNGDQIQVIDMTPVKDKDKKSFYKVKLTVNTSKMKIDKIEILHKDATKEAYELTSFVTDEDIPDSYFVFNKENYTNIEVNDLKF